MKSAYGRLLAVVFLVVATQRTFAEVTAEETTDGATADPCTNIELPEVLNFTAIRNEQGSVIGYALVLQQNDVRVVPAWHRFHQIPEVRSHDFNYPLPPNDPQFEIRTAYNEAENTMETSVRMKAQYDDTLYGLQLDMTSSCGPISIYIKPHMREFQNVTKFPTIQRKPKSVAAIHRSCLNRTIHLEQITQFHEKNADGTAGLTRILAKKLGVNDMEEVYDAYEFNPDPNAYYQLDNTHTDNGRIAKQSWVIDDVTQNDYIGLYQFYITIDSADPIYKVNNQDAMVYMVGIPFVVKPDHFEAISVGILPCYPFRTSATQYTRTPIKDLGFVEGYRPCFRVLAQSSQPINLELQPYIQDSENPLPTYSGPDIGGMREHWYVLDPTRLYGRVNRYLYSVFTHDFVFMIPFALTRYIPAKPSINVETAADGTKTLSCTTLGSPEPKVKLYEMNRQHTLGGDTHWDLERIVKRFHALHSEETYRRKDNTTEVTVKRIEMTVSPYLEDRLKKSTFNMMMPFGIACVSWNDFSHNIDFWTPVGGGGEETPEEEEKAEIEVKEKIMEEIAAEDVMPSAKETEDRLRGVIANITNQEQ